MMSPPTIAPGTEVRPPRITTGSARSATVTSENCTPIFEPQMMPATRATRPATHHTITQVLLSGMPTDCAAWWSSATARSARPIAVFWKNTVSPATSTAASAAAMKSSLLISTPPSKRPSNMITGSLGMPTSIE